MSRSPRPASMMDASMTRDRSLTRNWAPATASRISEVEGDTSMTSSSSVGQAARATSWWTGALWVT